MASAGKIINLRLVTSRDALALIAAKDRGGGETGCLGQISHVLHLPAALTAFAAAGLSYLMIGYGD
jgi:hypothetical protein